MPRRFPRPALRSCLAALAVLAVALTVLAARASSAAAVPATWGSAGSLADARSSHTATRLFGGKFLLAGGAGSAGSLASAELFDPQTGAVTTTGSLGAARSSHTATLISGAPFQCTANCGSVLVAGGSGANGTALASAELFNPATGTWTSTGPLAGARSAHAAILLPNGRILVSGGIGTDGKPLATAEVFNPANGSWTATGSLADARAAHAATLLSDGKVLVTGGVGADGKPVGSAEVYDTTTGTWAKTAAPADARFSHASTALGDSTSGRPDRRVLITGGTGPDGKPLASAELYDPATGRWAKTGALADARTSHAAAVLSDGKVLVTGGLGADGRPLATVELYDPGSGTWSKTGSVATARSSHTVVPLLDGRVLATGGASAGGKLASMEIYEPSLGPRWAPTDPLADARSGHTATLLGDGEVLVIGGHTSFDFSRSSGPGCCNLTPLASAEIYDPKTGRWRSAGALQRARSFHTATLLPNGKVLVTGGFGTVDPPTLTGNAQTLSSAELYDPATGRWASTSPMLQARAWHTATLLENGKVLVVGGAARADAGSATDSAELYDPVAETWTATGALTGAGNQKNNSGPNGARQNHTATLLDKNCGRDCGKVLVVGGTGGFGSGSAYATAELYDPVLGTFLPTGRMIEVRQVHTATALPNGKVLVSGGFSNPFAAFPPHLERAELYNPDAQGFEAAASLGNRRMYQTANLLPDGTVLAAGGNAGGNAPSFPNQAGPGLLSSELYNPESNAWIFTDFMNTGRVLHTATLLPAGPPSVCGDNCGKVLAVGGDREVIGSFTPYLRYISPLRSAELYTPASPPATPTPTPTPTASATPTPPVTLTPTPTVTPTPRRRPGLSATVRPKRDRKRPYRFTTRGTLKRPSSVSRARGCKGKVRVTVRRKGHGKTLSSRLATVRGSCKFTSKVTFKSRKRFGKGRKGTLRFTIRFQGNARLLSKSITRTARYAR